jgi:uncharacterized protein involved in exopolysaccharide biosynthesis
MWTGNCSFQYSATQVRAFVGAISRAGWVLLAWILLWSGLGLAYTISVKPEFVAKVDILIEPQHIAVDVPGDKGRYNQLALGSERVDTELQVLRSPRLLRPVFDELHLVDAPEFVDDGNGFRSSRAPGLQGLSPTSSTPDDEETRVFYAFADRVRSMRVGLSHVIELSYRSQDPNRAADVANAIAAAYVGDRLARLSAYIGRIGGAYRVSRADALAAEIAQTRAAVRDQLALNHDLYYADVRLLGPASPPPVKSYPKTGPTVLFAMGFGAISGVMITLFRAKNPIPRILA